MVSASGGSHIQRRLAAVLVSDVVGYSRLMEIDEAGTLAALKAHRKALFEPAVADHDGRVVKLMGDGVLAEFASIVNAVTCAVVIQKGMAERNEGVPEQSRVELRIGVHLGDVIVEDDDIYGDGVNVAARLEGMAEPGGICLSQQAYDQVETKLDLPVQDLGPQQVKNIARPVRVYRVLGEDEDPGPAKAAARRRPSAARLVGSAVAIVLIAGGLAVGWWQPWKPDAEPDSMATVESSQTRSVAVLPFQNIGGDPKQEYFADGLTEDLTTDLAKFPLLEVTARTSMAAYKGKSVDVRR